MSTHCQSLWKTYFLFNHYLLVTLLNPKISFLFNAKIKKTTFEFICHNRAKQNISLGIIIISNESVKEEIVNACYHLVTNNITLLPIAIKIGPFKNCGDFSITNSFKFGFPLFHRVLLLILFSCLFLFHVLLIWFVFL